MPQTIVDIVFPYLVKFIRPRKRNAETEYFRGTLPVAIESVSTNEAPVACVIDENPSRKDHELYLKEVRRYEGRFYLPEITDEQIPAVDVKLLKSAAGKTGADWKSSPFHELGTRGFDEPLRQHVRNLPEAREVDVREVVNSARDEVERRIKAEATNYLLIDGVLHRACPEPRLLVDHRHHGVEVEAIFDDDYPRNRWVNAVFGVHEQDKVAEYIRRLIEQGDVHKDYVQEGHAVDRIDPTVPWSDFSADSLEACISLIMEKARKAVAWLPGLGIEAFIRMKEAHRAFIMGDTSREVISKFCTAYAEIAAQCDSEKLDREVVEGDPEWRKGHNDAFYLAEEADRRLLRFRIEGLVAEPALPEEAELALAELGK